MTPIQGGADMATRHQRPSLLDRITAWFSRRNQPAPQVWTVDPGPAIGTASVPVPHTGADDTWHPLADLGPDDLGDTTYFPRHAAVEPTVAEQLAEQIRQAPVDATGCPALDTLTTWADGLPDPATVIRREGSNRP